MKNIFIIFVILLGMSLPALAEDLYKWVDEKGVVHYGDAIPAAASGQERHVLNRQGVTVKVLDRQKTIEELNAMANAAAESARSNKVEEQQQERDRILLDTYLSVEEIEMLRDRRILSIEARLGVTRHYLDNLRQEWDELETEASRFNFPYDPTSNLLPLPEELAEHIVFTENAMAEHMTSLRDLRGQQAAIRKEFDVDINRFKLLKAQQELASAAP